MLFMPPLILLLIYVSLLLMLLLPAPLAAAARHAAIDARFDAEGAATLRYAITLISLISFITLYKKRSYDCHAAAAAMLTFIDAAAATIDAADIIC